MNFICILQIYYDFILRKSFSPITDRTGCLCPQYPLTYEYSIYTQSLCIWSVIYSNLQVQVTYRGLYCSSIGNSGGYSTTVLYTVFNSTVLFRNEYEHTYIFHTTVYYMSYNTVVSTVYRFLGWRFATPTIIPLYPRCSKSNEQGRGFS